MRGEHTVDQAHYRALKATAFVLCLVLSVPVVELLLDSSGASNGFAETERGIDSRALTRSGNPFTVLDQVEELTVAGSEKIPDAFSEEIGFLSGADDVRVDDTGTVVGYVVPGDSADALDSVVAHMEERGWTAISLGAEVGATFVKGDGACKWALVTCTQVDRVTSIVVRCKYI